LCDEVKKNLHVWTYQILQNFKYIILENIHVLKITKIFLYWGYMFNIIKLFFFYKF